MASDEEIRTLAVKIAMDASSFTQQAAEFKRQLSDLDSGFKSSVAGISNWGTKTDSLKAQVDSLGQRIDVQRQVVESYQSQVAKTSATLQAHSEQLVENQNKVEALKSAYEESASTLGKNADETKALKDQLSTAESELSNSEKQVMNNQKSVYGYNIQLNNATAKLKDMEAELKNANSALFDHSNALAVAGDKLQSAGEKITDVSGKISNAGQSLTMGVTVPIVAAGTASVKMAMDFESSSAKVATIADSTVMSMDKMKQGALDLSTETGADVNDINQALYQAMSAGIKTGDSLQFVGDSVKLAKGGFTDTTTAIDTLTSVLNAYHMQASQANTISDQLIKTQDLGKTTVADLGQSLGQVIPIAASLNVKTQDLFSSIAELTKNGMPADEAITSIKGALSAVIKPSSDAAQEAKNLGINFSATHLENVGFAQFINEISQATHGNAQEMGTLFGNVRALNGMMVLAGQGNQDFNATLQDMAGATGATNDAFEKVEDNGAAKFDKAINAIKNDGIKAGEDLLPEVAKVTDEIAKLTDGFSKMSPAAQDNILKWGLLAAAAGPVLMGIGGIGQGIGTLTTVVGKGASGVANFVKGIAGIMPAEGEAVPAMASIGSAVATFVTNPFGIAALAIAGVAAALMTVITQHLLAKNAMDDLINSLKTEDQAWANLQKTTDQKTQSDLAELNRTQALWQELQKLVDVNGNVVGSKDQVIRITQLLNSTAGTELQVIGNTVQGYKDACSSIDEYIAKKRAQILIDDKEESYKQALANVQQSQLDQAKAYNDMQELSTKISAEEADQSYKTDAVKASNLLNDKNILESMEGEYKKHQSTLDGYYSTINSYESAMAAEAQGDYGKVAQVLQNSTLQYTIATGENLAQLKQQATDTATMVNQMVVDRANGNKNITDNQINSARDLANKAQAEYATEAGIAQTGGSNVGSSFAGGLNSQSGNANVAGKNVGNSAASGAQSTSGAANSTGAGLGKTMAGGFNSVGGELNSAGVNGANSIKNGANSANMTQTGSNLAAQLKAGWDSFLKSNPLVAKADAALQTLWGVGHNASGTNDWRGGLTYINEKGGELVNLPGGTQIIPHDVSMEIARAVGQAVGSNISPQSSYAPQVSIYISNGSNMNPDDVASAVSNALARRYYARK